MGKSKELAELGDVVTQSSGNVGIGISTVVAPLHVGTEGTHGITAWFGDESSFVDNASYHYTDARVGISGRDSDNTDHGAGIEFTSRNTGSSNWLHGYLVHNRDGAFAFGTGGAGTSSAPERMRIDASGRVTMPYQPAFTAGRTTGQVSAGTYYVFNAVSHNIGGHYNASNGRFTAPVTGSYLISFQNLLGSGNTTTNNDAQLHINGGRIGETRSEDRTGLWSTASLTKVVYMNAGDYVQIYADTGVHYGNDQFWCTFSGYLIG